MRAWARALAMVMAMVLGGCNGSLPATGAAVGEPSAVLTPEAPAAELALPAGSARGVLLDIVRVINPELNEARLGIYLPGADRPFQTVSLYPPDQPARIALTPPPDAAAVIVRLESGAGRGPRLEIALAPLRQR